MAETTTKPKPVVTIPAHHQRGTAVARFAGVVDRTSQLSDQLLASLETDERAAIEAAGRFPTDPHAARVPAQDHRQHRQVA